MACDTVARALLAAPTYAAIDPVTAAQVYLRVLAAPAESRAVEWIVRRVCDGGRMIRNHQRMAAGDVCGTLSITEEHDEGRNRTVPV